jgi:hypothetical protein
MGMADKEKLKKFQDFARECLEIMAQASAAFLKGDNEAHIQKADEVADKLLNFESTISWCELEHVHRIYEVLKTAEKICVNHIFDDHDDCDDMNLIAEIKMILADDYDSYDLC